MAIYRGAKMAAELRKWNWLCPRWRSAAIVLQACSSS